MALPRSQAMTNGATDAFAAQLPGLRAPLVLCDSGGGVLAATAEAEAIIGPLRPGTGLLGGPVPDGDPGFRRAWTTHAASQSAWQHNAQIRDHTRLERHLRLLMLPVQVRNGDGHGYLVLIDDLTETTLHARQMEAYAQDLGQLYMQNREQLEQLQIAQAARDHFYSLVSHELKTPLTAMHAALEMLTTTEPTEWNAQHIQRLMMSTFRASQRMEQLVEDLLDTALLRSGGRALKLAPVDLVQVIAHIRDEMVPLAMRKGVVVRGPARHWQVWACGDSLRLQQVVQNLLSNAIKATASGGTIQMSAKQDPSFARVTISNPGTIPPPIRETMFQPFIKSAADGGYQSGSGLGLAIVAALVEAHGGTVTMEESRGRVVAAFTVPLLPENGQCG